MCISQLVKLPAQISAVTFDVGGTLIQPWPSVGHIYAEAAVRQGQKNISPELLNTRFAAAWAGLKDFAYTRGEWARLVDETFHGLTDLPPSQTFFPKLYQDFTRASSWNIFDDVLPALESLAAQGLKLGIISNWDERLRPLLDVLRLYDHFGAIAISCEVGFAKPSRVIFETASKELGLPVETILHVGDSLVEDLRGARGCGFQALLLRRASVKPGPDEIRTLRELHA